ncbi:hypothetical protein Q7C36_011060 [Tachysurus vachellii]|uniref:Intersectin-2 n=1 Tax=Tachysurus vachellii TaxID=175792 RepID=A0AA88MZE5_TACVA|nr:hypothetical protein Q7C36_011060 [Tachysurus vachellii]
MLSDKTNTLLEEEAGLNADWSVLHAGGFNIWAITPEERGKHDKQFDSLTPTLGYVSGDQARNFFLQSGLPASVLAEIWALADMGKDGRMDRLEFSIAMKLIKLQLQGHPLPPALPIIMKQTPAPVMTSSSRFGMGSMPNLSIMPTMPMLTPMPVGSSVTSMTSLTSMPAVQPLLPLIPDSLNMSSNSSSTTSLASNSPKTGTSDWAVPQSSRLKYRQQFNILDKLMTGYLSGPQVRNALAASNLTQTQLATIWTLADVDRDGQLRADEFILAMHLVDMAKTGRPLPLTLPADLMPPSFRTGKSCDLPNGSIPLLSTELIEPEPAHKCKNNVSFEDKLRENFQRGSLELEKRRQALQEEQRREQERRREEERREEERRRLREREEQERREREALRRQKEEEQRMERQREMERRREEERLKEMERQEAAERQRRVEWERTKLLELQAQNEKEKRDIERLTARKRSLELELEAVGNRHKQISNCLRDAQSKRRVKRAELELINQKRDGSIADINSLQLQFEDVQRQLSSLAPEKQRLTEKLRDLTQTNASCAEVNNVKRNKCEKDLSCRKLKEQLDALERETTAKLSEVERYNRDMKLVEMDDCMLQGLLSLLGCLTNLFLLIKELRERQQQQQAVLEQLNRVKLEKVKELQRRREEEEEKRRRDEELARQAKLEQERLQEEQERLQEEEAERQRRLAQEKEAKLREEQQLQAQARLRELQEKAAKQEREEREAEERRRAEEKEREEKKKSEEKEKEEKRKAEEKDGKEKGVDGINEQNPVSSISTDIQSQLSTLFNSTSNTTGVHLSGLIHTVDESTVREPGWLYGTYQGSSGWFPESYAEKTCKNNETTDATQNTVTSTNYFRHTLEKNDHNTSLCAWTATTDTQLGFSKDDIITVLEQQENWWYGELGENQGWFPKTHVSMMTANNTLTEPLYSTVDELDLADSVLLEEYVALYTYESPESGDLTFRAEDVVLVMEKEGEWWKGCIGDQSGLFPSNYVKPKDTDSAKSGASGKKPEIAQVTTACKAMMAEQLNVTPGQLILVLHKNSCGWWLGELQARGKKRQKGWFHSSNVRLLEPNSGKTTPAPQPLCQVIAMYDYKAANGDEMTFQKGQLINVLNKDESDWWKGEINGVTGLFPTNYVKMTTESDPSQQWCADLLSLDSMSCEERKRQGYIHELIETEQTYVQDLELVLEVFYKPMTESGRLTEAEMSVIFVNWRELIMCNIKLLKALRVRKKTAGERMPVQVIGDILSSELSHMQPYIRFCSCQLNAAALLQQKTDASPEFKLFLKKIATNYRCKGMPLSSFLLKPMQRITRYPLLIKNILENTPVGHVDQVNLREALERAELLCSQVNEGVREKENSDRLEWLQNHVQCEGVIEHLVFNSLTNCLGPRKLLHSGHVSKAKSNKELWAFLFSDFLLFTYISKQFSSNTDRLFSPKSNTIYKMYKTPVFLNEVLVKMPSDPSSEDPVFHISHIDRVYTLKADSINERTTWVQRIKAASEHFIETEKLKREKAYQARSQKTSGIGRLLVTAQEAVELKPCKPNGKSNPYCELSMGAQCYTSRPQNDTVNPKWNFSCQFFIKDLYQDVLCITVFERDQFSPDDFLGRTEVPVATIKKDQEGKGPLTRRLLLHEVPTGEVRVRLDLQLYEQTPLL